MRSLLLLLLLDGSHFVIGEILVKFIVRTFFPFALEVLPHSFDEFVLKFVGSWLAYGLPESHDAESLFDGQGFSLDRLVEITSFPFTRIDEHCLLTNLGVWLQALPPPFSLLVDFLPVVAVFLLLLGPP